MRSKKPVLCVALCLLAPACQEGDRAISGECPVGETCSDATPEGLRFVGASRTAYIGLGGIPWTAVGGIQTLKLSDVATDMALDVPWRAELEGALVVAGTDSSQVVVRGVSEGQATLRIVDAESGELLDRHELYAAPITAIELASGAELVADRPLGWMAGLDIDAGVALRGAGGDRLVDEGLIITAAEPARLERLAWDHVLVTDAPPGDLTLTASAGQLRDQQVVTPVVDAVEAVVPGVSLASDPAKVGDQDLLCFDAMQGDHAVMGLAWTITTSGAAITRHELDVANCIHFETIEVGPVTITAAAGGQATELVVDVGPAAQARARTRACGGCSAIASPGERARLHGHDAR